MFAINFLIPIAIAYLAWIPYCKKQGYGILKKLKVHFTVLGTVAFVVLVQTFLYMDFLAVLSFSLWKLISGLLISFFATFINSSRIAM